MKLLLIRHGDAEDKDGNTQLTIRGKEEAIALSKRLAKINIDKIYVSSYLRAKQTLEPLIKIRHILVEESEDIKEIYRVLVGGPVREGTSKEREHIDRERIEKFWQKIQEETGTIAVFTHGNVIRYILSRALNISAEKTWDSLLISTGSISIISISNDTQRIDAINITEHLPNANDMFCNKNIETIYHP